MNDSMHSFEQYGTSTTELLHNEIRNVLQRYWRAIDRARLQFFHIWLFIFSILQTGLIYYLMPKVNCFFSQFFGEHYFSFIRKFETVPISSRKLK